MTNNTKKQNGPRFDKGDVVYFVEGENIIGRGDPVVKKASVTEVEMPDGSRRENPNVTLWGDVDEDPKGLGMSVAKAPETLFTESDVQAALEAHGHESVADRPVDELITDPGFNRELTAVLGSVMLERTADK